MAIENAKFKILGDFLKSRRERIKPEGVAIASRYGRRRTPGLRREEVAQLAGLSITWYTWLEQGRVASVSREVIESVARALQLSSDEQAHLFRLADYGGERNASLNTGEPYPELQAIIDQVNYPAIIANHRTEVLAYNRLATEIITDFHAIPADERVMTRLIFTDPNLREQLVNWQEFADFTIGVFRTYYDQNASDAWFEAFVQQMCLVSEEFQTLWRLHNVQQKKAMHYTFDHCAAGQLYFQLNTFSNINGDDNLHCCIFTPIANTVTEAKLADLRQSSY
ncbi:helix-turn-helix transcriptional regulator [Paenibacillus sp. MMS18-CY102]|uniref:helix-turn-helix transcriptional regulator n=1 Tax=Paenibacillus sp. MMS18-CY102 TaxID=2682849 RepID=UPI0013662A15|nr:helix-turn-helix transcriptional regulator [Paenibacillus sp. MMS18-CY102]MWC29157.1 helix-turn-helix domain-containing protein [Paenibacillus sp. MMS18-CY102]